MKAVLCREPGVLDIVERPSPAEPAAGWVRLAVSHVGICGTDYHIFEGKHPFLEYPRLIGHELSGVVAEVGEGVEIAAGSPNGRLYAQSLSMGLVLHLSRNRRAQGRLARERGRLSTDQQRRLRDFIHADLAADLSLDSLARAVGYSPSQFTRLFRNSFGKSAHRYVLTQRVAKAQALLRESALPLADIAQSCGFSGQSHMTSVFTRELGMSPGVLRRLHRTSSSSARDRDDG